MDVKNTGEYDGEEVAQLRIRQLRGSVTAPVKALKGFERGNAKEGRTRAPFEFARPNNLTCDTMSAAVPHEPG